MITDVESWKRFKWNRLAESPPLLLASHGWNLSVPVFVLHRFGVDRFALKVGWASAGH